MIVIMRKIYLIIALAFVSLTSNAQLFNFSLRTNNQQVIDIALDGAFAKVNQSYELCDTISNEHFGRNDNNYFSIIPFLGIETERGLCVPIEIMKPWLMDKDFDEYQNRYQPLVTGTKYSTLNSKSAQIRSFNTPIIADSICDGVAIFSDTTFVNRGLKVDTIQGSKDGWLIWLSTTGTLNECDSIKITSIHKTIEISTDDKLSVDAPDNIGTNVGGIFITPSQTNVGQVTFLLSGILVKSEDEWNLVFPFLQSKVDVKKPLTPISGSAPKNQFNQLKKKRK